MGKELHLFKMLWKDSTLDTSFLRNCRRCRSKEYSNYSLLSVQDNLRNNPVSNQQHFLVWRTIHQGCQPILYLVRKKSLYEDRKTTKKNRENIGNDRSVN